MNQSPAYGRLVREDNDYALAWVRQYGRGRVFYCTIAHSPSVFWDPKLLEFYLAAAQFALGDLPAPTTPSSKLTPAIRAQEKLGWRLGIEAYTFHKYTLFEAIDKTAQLGLPYMGGLSFQKVSNEIAKNFDPQLTDDELKQIRLKLDSAGVRLLTYYIHDIPGDPEGCRRVFEFGRKIGIETFMSEPSPDALDTIEKFCDEYDINVALHNHDQKASPQYWNPEGILKVCEDRSRRIGACGDLGYWMRSGIDPIEAVRTLKQRLITVQMHDLNELTPTGHDVPWGTGAGKTGAVPHGTRPSGHQAHDVRPGILLQLVRVDAGDRSVHSVLQPSQPRMWRSEVPHEPTISQRTRRSSRDSRQIAQAPISCGQPRAAQLCRRTRLAAPWIVPARALGADGGRGPQRAHHRRA